ncbi:MAG: DUF3341 domain-containing protein [Gemmatimonadales bacterium]
MSASVGVERTAAVFGSAEALLAGVDALAAAGHRTFTTYAPHDVEELDGKLGLRRPILAGLALAGGLAGAVTGFAIQWWSDVHAYRLNVGGRPAHPIPAFIPVTFELTILGAALAVFFGLLITLRLPRLWAPIDEADGFDRVSADRFWLLTEQLDASATTGVEHLLQEAGASRVWRLEC